ncbi:hypothetical protein GCM10009830_30480 [Glycomyces endophyticus]|uniref:DUF1206 domain-containing protein n=1 Tax=Glycomyces endophyticus TaxID=480996 RepID=A0ABP4T2E8_9ACTN
MIANILLGLVATAIAGGIIVSARLVRDRVDPQGRVPNDQWKLLMLAAGVSVGLTMLFAWFLAWVLGWIVRYAAKVLTSVSEAGRLTEPERMAVDVALKFLERESWFWSWPYVLFALVIGLLAWGFEETLKAMEVGMLDRLVDHVLAGATAVGAMAIGFAVGFMLHWGFDAGSTWLFERSQQATSEGAVDFYPRDSAITIGWSRFRSATTLGYAAFLLIGGAVAVWRIARRGLASLRTTAASG